MRGGQAAAAAGDDTSATLAAAAAQPSAPTHALEAAPEATLAASNAVGGLGIRHHNYSVFITLVFGARSILVKSHVMIPLIRPDD